MPRARKSAPRLSTQKDAAALEQRHRQERRRLLADTFGAEVVRRDPARYELTHPDREAAEQARLTSEARARKLNSPTIRWTTGAPVRSAMTRA